MSLFSPSIEPQLLTNATFRTRTPFSPHHALTSPFPPFHPYPLRSSLPPSPLLARRPVFSLITASKAILNTTAPSAPPTASTPRSPNKPCLLLLNLKKKTTATLSYYTRLVYLSSQLLNKRGTPGSQPGNLQPPLLYPHPHLPKFQAGIISHLTPFTPALIPIDPPPSVHPELYAQGIILGAPAPASWRLLRTLLRISSSVNHCYSMNATST